MASAPSMQKDKNEGKLHQGINLLFPRVHVSQANIHNIFGSYAGCHPGESWYIRDLKIAIFHLVMYTSLEQILR